MKGNAAIAAPRKLCPLDRHLMLASQEVCYGCVMEWEAEDQAARDREAGRTGNDPDYQGEENAE